MLILSICEERDDAMITVTALSGTQILAIPTFEPERLFELPELVSSKYKELALRWHPDLPSGDEAVFKHIVALHEQAKHRVVTDAWHVPGRYSFTDLDGKSYALHYFKTFDFELGKAYLSDTRVTYVIRDEFADLVDNAKRIIAGLRFPDKATEDVMRRYLPQIKSVYRSADSTIVMIDKPADLIRMRDLLEHLGGKIDATHVAWMVSRMLNHASFFEVTGLSHNDLSLDTLFVCPEHHTVCVLGGWWYAALTGEKLKALPQRTISNAPNDVLRTKLASVGTDAELVRLTGRELLGNGNGIHLTKNTAIPAAMVSWLRLSGKGSPVKDYTEWREKILMASFGPRKFVKMLVTASEVYPPL
jgi:hypothetical protein